MKAPHLELLGEEPSMEAFLHAFLARLLPVECTFMVHTFQGKHDLLRKLPERLRGYQRWLPSEWRLVVLVDQDEEDCLKLKARLEDMAKASGLLTRTRAVRHHWQVVNRIVVQELEAWYFGDWEAVRDAYPRVSPTVPRQARYRDSDAIRGGTWEAFERILRRRGYFRTGLRKIEVAQAVAANIEIDRNRSHSFMKFHQAIAEVVL